VFVATNATATWTNTARCSQGNAGTNVGTPLAREDCANRLE